MLSYPILGAKKKSRIRPGEFKRQTNSHKHGYRKIDMTCEIAAQHGLNYVWIDTCCINQSSSAELTEAINSMFKWYQRSKICYVFLEDLSASAAESAVIACRWFTRGWTLQELLAPLDVRLFDQEWKCRGSKEDFGTLISMRTYIPPDVLLNQRALSTVPVAQRMSWAAQRETTRMEDAAYCLLGLFNVNMPLLYGEEHTAFRRLQLEILKTSTDLSIFAWSMRQDAGLAVVAQEPRLLCGLLAESPAAFELCRFLIHDHDQSPEEFAVTNMGIKTQTKVFIATAVRGKEIKRGYILPLRCSTVPNKTLAVRLRKCGRGQFAREDPFSLTTLPEHKRTDDSGERYLLTDILHPSAGLCSMIRPSSYVPHLRRAVMQIVTGPEFRKRDIWDWSRFDDEDSLFFVQASREDVCAIGFEVNVPGNGIALPCTFYAVQWSSFAIDGFQYTIFPDSQFKGSLSTDRSVFDKWDYNTEQTLRRLKASEIPRMSKFAFKIPRLPRIAVISTVATLESDPEVCLNQFWRLRFSVDVVDGETPPQFSSKKWVLR